MTKVRALTAASYLSMLFLGVSGSLIGAVARNIGLTPFQIGLFLTVQNLGFMLSVWISGALADSQQKSKILLVGSLILAASFLAFYQIRVFWVNLIWIALIGVGVGTYEGVTDALLIEQHPDRQNFHININHFFVTLGSILITLYLTYLQMNWRASLQQSAGVVVLLAIFFALVRTRKPESSGADYRQRLRVITGERLILVLFVATFLMIGTEIGTVGILTTYLMELRGFTQVTSKLGLVTFLAGIALGRVWAGYFARQERIIAYLLTMFAMGAILYSLLFYLDLGVWNYGSVFLTGAGISALFPLMITLAGLRYPHMAGTVIGTLKIAIPVGGILVPFTMSLLARLISLRIAVMVFPLAMLLALGLLGLEFRRSPQAYRSLV